MSQTTTPPDDDRDRWLDFVDEHREEIEREAEADTEAAWVFQEMLDYADSGGSS